MHIRKDEVARIAVDQFTSTSGRYLFILGQATVRGHNCYDFVALDPATYRVVKIVRLAVDDMAVASLKWEALKMQFTAAGEEEEQEDAYVQLPTASQVYAHMEKIQMLKMKPRGARIFVTDIQPIDEVTARAQEAGLVAVVDERNKPKPTMGIVVAVGEDPLAHDLYKVGDILLFSKHAGGTFSEAGVQFRFLDLHEVIGLRSPEDGIEDIVGKA